MKRPSTAVLLAAALLAIFVLAFAGSVSAAGDDDIPGTSLATGVTVSQTVSSGDVSDVYAVNLSAGLEVHIRCDPGTTGAATGVFHLVVPGAASIGAIDPYDELVYTLRAGSPTRSWADFDYIPAQSGAYYLWVSWESATLNYSLSAKRTSRPAIDLAQDADDVPGTEVGAGIHSGVVSTLADPDDIYAVELSAGRTVTIRLIPVTPYNNSVAASAYLYLLDPGTPSLSDRFGHVLDGLVQAINDKSIGSRKVAEIQYTPTE
ncbi:MAG TPA: hypothetical protein VJP78_01400, partial [Thermoleophilia bacterium]|nr:hypothetical protein [Thermoleophilia bacterium]